MKILGISCHYHNSAAALIIDGNLISCSLEERFSRKKHDSSFPQFSVKFCLDQAGISAKELDYIVFYEKPFLKFERIYQTIMSTVPKSYFSFRNATFATFGEKLWIRSLISIHLNIDKNKILFLPHHLSHASSSFLASPFKESAILTIDGVGEWSTATIGRGNKNGIEIMEELRFPPSLGLLYSTFTAYLGFEVNEGEYKVMGMAGYGKPRFKSKVYKVCKVHKDGSLEPDLSYFSYSRHHRKMFSSKFETLFGPARIPKTHFDISDKSCRRYADIAASIQEVTEETVVKMAKHAKRITGSENLCLAGGVALNGRANHRLYREKIFKNIFVQPAAGDAGGALGAALYVDYTFGSHKRFVMDNVYYGKEYRKEEIKKFLHNHHIKTNNQQPTTNNYLADQLSKGKIIGWFDGRFEWGPRALGARSILADPRNPRMKMRVNEKIKFREPFRPFAPSVLAEHAHEYFEMQPQTINNQPPTNNPQPTTYNLQLITPFDFMLYVVNVKKEKRKKIPAVTHTDGTSRPQLVRKEISPRYYALIEAFYNLTGVPMLLNTSFNLATEPIVASPADALRTFQSSGLDILVLGDYIIEK